MSDFYELKIPEVYNTWRGLDGWIVTTTKYSGILLHNDGKLRSILIHHTIDGFTTGVFKTETDAHVAINKYYHAHGQPHPYFFSHGKWREIPDNGQTTIDVAESQVMRFK